MKNYVNKETFKKYLTECPKAAWALSNLKNFEKAAVLQKNKKFIFNIDKDVENSDDYNNSRSFNNNEYYMHLFEKNELTADELKQKMNFIDAFKEDGFLEEEFAGSSIEDGNLVGEFARQLFTKKNLLENKKNNTNKKWESVQLISNMVDASNKTKKYLEDENVRYIFEPAFLAMEGNLRTRCDILLNKGNNHVEIIEVKATTSLKIEHLLDVYYQKKILEMCGLIVDDVSLCVLNSLYYKGETITDIDEIEEYKFEDFQDELDELINSELEYNEIDDQIEIDKLLIVKNEYVLKNKNKTKKIIEILNNIDGILDFESLVNEISDYLDNPLLDKETCCKIRINSQINKETWVGISDENYCHHVIEWYDQKKLNVFDLKYQKNVTKARIKIEYGITYLEDLNYDELAAKDDKFNKPNAEFQMQIIKKWLAKKPISIFNPKALEDVKNMLEKWYSKYPIYMFDFETSMWAVPKFNKTKSYQQIPFQYSLDIICGEGWNHDSKIIHKQFLANERKDPREMLIKQMIKDMFSNGPGIYVAYNESFEKSVIKNLITAFPKYKKPLSFIHKNTVDLMKFFFISSKSEMNTSGEGVWIYHPDFKKSYSIKYTQPALYPELSYKDLYINKGTRASEAFRMYIDEFTPKEEWDESIYKNMLKYCNRDTMAMVVLLEVIIKLLKKYESEGYTHNV